MRCRRCRRGAGEENPDRDRHYQGTKLHLLLPFRRFLRSIVKAVLSGREQPPKTGEDGDGCFTPAAVYVAYRSDVGRSARAEIEINSSSSAHWTALPLPGSLAACEKS
jgi:hypothetical protein